MSRFKGGSEHVSRISFSGPAGLHFSLYPSQVFIHFSSSSLVVNFAMNFNNHKSFLNTIFPNDSEIFYYIESVLFNRNSITLKEKLAYTPPTQYTENRTYPGPISGILCASSYQRSSTNCGLL